MRVSRKPDSLKQKILNDSFITNLANLISQGLSVLQGFIILRFINPDSYGMWLGLLILLRYGAYAHLGLEYGLMFRLPYYIGQDNAERTRQVQDNTFFGWTVLTILFAAGVLGYYFLFANVSNSSWFGLIVILVMLFADQQSAFLNRWHASAQKDFKSYGIISIVKGIVSFIIIVPLSYYFQIVGLMAGSLIVSIVTAVLWWARTSFRPRLNLSSLVSKELVIIGFPYLLSVIGGVLTETVDRILVLNLLGAVHLGYYAITSMGGNSLYGLLTQAGTVMLPHMVEDSGRFENDFTVLEKYLIKPTIYLAYLSILMILFLVIFIPVIVDVWLTEYRLGLLAFYFFVPGFFFLSIIISANNILSVILVAQKKQFWLVVIQYFAVLVEIVVCLSLIQRGWGIAGAALGSTLAYMTYSMTILNISSAYVAQNRRSHFQFLMETFLPFAYGALLVFIFLNLPHFPFGEILVLRAVCQFLLVVICFVPLVYRLDNRYSLFRDVRAVPIISQLPTFIKHIRGQ